MGNHGETTDGDDDGDDDDDDDDEKRIKKLEKIDTQVTARDFRFKQCKKSWRKKKYSGHGSEFEKSIKKQSKTNKKTIKNPSKFK